MKKFWVDYEATMLIEAETEEEVEDIFDQVYADDTRHLARITKIEEIEEEE